ncbi:hypothetical protein HBA18_08340 [Salinivibrio costicola]|uniref:Uncharacterized protein n=1 Tax=Salinivibrio costicola TaxID=51367 RepID=A0ABX6K4B3_SALCS|nr:hypothetical protein HBA18_08340 [Salinivibrio costicola]
MLGGSEIVQDSHDYEGHVISAVKQFASSINSKSKVVSDMSMLVHATNKLPLSGLDYWERLIRSEFYNALDTSTKANWKFWKKPSQILTWLDLISWDGYKREKTLRTLSGAAPNSFFFALAIRRLNDWVPQVREAAREKLPLIVDASDPTYVVDALCVTLSNWNSWGRIEQKDKDVLLEIISKEKIGNALKAKIISSTSGPMASLMAQVGRTPVLDDYLNEIAESAVQPSVRAKAFRSQFEKRMVWLEGRKFEWTDIRYCEGRVKPIIGERDISVCVDFNELLEKSSTDTSSIVKRVAAEMLIRELENMGEKGVQLANLFASDKSSAVAERGRFALKKLEESQV